MYFNLESDNCILCEIEIQLHLILTNLQNTSAD